jgi:methylmalonyl-CoA mutase|tara:strand:- start:13072 stop:14364 length:1293 start_codon:yes stop_codon:yes gene_type:complete
MKLFTEFQQTTHEEWRSLVDKELKGLSYEDTLTKKDEIEEIDFSKFADERENSSSQLTFERCSKSKNNDWFIGKIIEVKDEKIANQEALTALNQGANSLTFVLLKKNILWEALFAEIGLDFIETQFKTLDFEQSKKLKDVFGKFSKKRLILLNDSIENNQIDSAFQGVQLAVNSYGIHQAGGNATQEIAFALSAGHAALHSLLNNGSSIDDAAAMLRFEMGIGANYFIEVAKFKVFRKLWANVVDAYKPKENCSHSCFIYAKTGFVNKSLKDPYTNLLRQSTEAMSAVLGGANEIQVQAYDKYAQSADRTLSERMALNISNILKEESYFDKVIDPLGGSYNLEDLSRSLELKSWSLFQELEKMGGIEADEARIHLTEKIKKTAALRKEKIAKGENILIGVNKYPSPDEKQANWMELPYYFGLDSLILEKQ